MSSTSLQQEFDLLGPETKLRLKQFGALVQKWSTKINLVSRSSVSELQDRHILDSLQLFSLRPGGATSWVDLGSGGGFPGMVIAIAAAEAAPDLHVTLLESDQRKAAFLRNVSRETDVPVTVVAGRIEEAPPLQADMISARALAPLNLLCSYAHRHLNAHGMALFLKGVSVEDEIALARQSWNFDLEQFASQTDAKAHILRLKGLSHV
ncbi:MAG: 16S rRNA (guanine(527)-N(7))-methyltransferase RsmG [Cereibacter sphaeroides]|uniref:Ribosomal RNA small subunit methyltransferase G n=1 Tax=Cereibacter sphaeroides TaxID=1063 RepID=A0A2W5U2W8_CERSP|nr:MAG: 16S rRNA (guanine(527)-N(7))-methyltransferase RsmG [Cereibacter sphaeroides]